MTKRVYRYEPDVVAPPGATLLETIEALSMSQTDLAARLRRPIKTINEIISGKAAITPETALQLETVLGVPASFWRNLENNYREYLARQEERERLKSDLQLLELVPVSAMARAGWIEKTSDKVEQVRKVLGFFGVVSAQALESLWAAESAAFRMSPAFGADRGAVAAWLRQGELEGQRIKCRPYDAKEFERALRDVRGMTKEEPSSIMEALQRACAKAGVAVVLVPELPKCRVSGAARWLGPHKALIQLSLRYRTDDQFWFSFFHEAGHILLHSKRRGFIENTAGSAETASSAGSDKDLENAADRFAAGLLIPPDEYLELSASHKYISEAAVTAFADKVGVAPGIVVGRLQHDGRVPHSHLNGLKRRMEWEAGSK